jgi:hypothetical protein
MFALRFVLHQSSAVLVLSALLAACGSKQVVKVGRDSPAVNVDQKRNTCLNVVNGVVSEKIPGVIMLRSNKGGVCTGTFLGDNVVLTAAHCVDGTANGGLTINGSAILPKEAVFVDSGPDAASRRPLNDIALLIFPDGTSKEWRKIASVPPKAGDALMVAGFGQTDFVNDNQVDGRLRFGYNVVDSVSSSDAILRYESPTKTGSLKPGEEAMSGRGDSGGPISVGDGVVALTSGGGTDSSGTRLIEEDFYLFSDNALKVIDTAEAKGAHINGSNHIRKALGKPLKANSPDVAAPPQDLTSC